MGGVYYDVKNRKLLLWGCIKTSRTESCFARGGRKALAIILSRSLCVSTEKVGTDEHSGMRERATERQLRCGSDPSAERVAAGKGHAETMHEGRGGETQQEMQ